MATRHVIADISYKIEAIECTCGSVMTADPDPYEHDRHQPLVEAWATHKREAAIARRARRAA